MPLLKQPTVRKAFRLNNTSRLLRAGVRFTKFCTVGALGVLVNAGVLHVLTEYLHINYKISSLCAIETAIINNFLINYFWTWSERRAGTLRIFLRMLLRFNLSCGAVAFVINWGLLVCLTEIFGWYYHISNFVGIALAAGVNFLLSHYWAFNRS